MRPKDQNVTARPGTVVKRLSLMGMLVLVGIVVAFIVASWAVRAFREVSPTEVRHPETGYTFPSRDAIASMTVTFIDDRGELHEFEAPKNSWEKIISCLTPSEYDPKPKKWDAIRSFRMMKIRTKQGDAHYIDFFKTYQMLGAFAAGPTFDSQRDYLGGNSAELEKALIAARGQSKRQDSNPM